MSPCHAIVRSSDTQYSKLISKAGAKQGRIHEFLGGINGLPVWLRNFSRTLKEAGIDMLSFGTLTIFIKFDENYVRVQTKDLTIDRMLSLTLILPDSYPHLVEFAKRLEKA